MGKGENKIEVVNLKGESQYYFELNSGLGKLVTSYLSESLTIRENASFLPMCYQAKIKNPKTLLQTS